MTEQTLADRQAAFMRAILDEDAPLPDGWGNSQAAGMSVYRGNYRFALMDALANTFERTARYVGEGPFKQASAHHAISHPPSGWTIDEAGHGFDATCADLFGENPEVSELAWLEWAMLEVSTAPDCVSFDPAGFAAATAEFGDEDWMGLAVEVMPRVTVRLVDHNLTGIWNALEEDELEMPALRLPQPQGCIVSREGERPTFMMVEPDNAVALSAMQQGKTYGEVIGLLAGEEPSDEAVQDAAMRAGGYLGNWLQEGLLVRLKA
ncbi:MAG: DNA-binding domain-containing protein [Pseudomonadota bacterium]